MQGVLDGFRLLVDLLHHEVLEAALFRRLGREGDLHRLLRHLVAVQVVESDAARREPRQLEVADVIDAAGVRQNGRHVGGDVGLTLRDADDHGRILARGEDFARVVLEHDLQRVAAPHPHHRLGDGVHRAHLVLFIIVVHQLNDHFRVRLAVKYVAVLQQLFPQLRIIFNNSIVDTHHRGFHLPGAGAGTVAGHVGMGVGFAGLPVGGPPGVADAAGSPQGFSVVGFLHQVAEPTLGLHHLGLLLAVPHGDPGGIISPVLQL